MVKNGTDIFWGGAFLSCLAWHATTVALLEQWHFLERAIFGWTCVDMILDPFLLDREKNDISVNRRTARCSWGTKVLLMLSCIVLTDFFTDAFWSLLCLGAECKAGARISCGSAALFCVPLRHLKICRMAKASVLKMPMSVWLLPEWVFENPSFKFCSFLHQN